MNKYFDPPDGDDDGDDGSANISWQSVSEVDTSQPTLTIANTETGAFGWEADE